MIKFTEIRVCIIVMFMSMAMLTYCPENASSNYDGTPTPEPDWMDSREEPGSPTQPARPTPAPTPTPNENEESAAATPRPTPTPRPTSTPAHRHRWVEITEDKDIYKTVNVYVYTCNGCGFTAGDEETIQEHSRTAEQNHGGYDDNIHIDTESVPIYGYRCMDEECGFTSTYYSEMIDHKNANSINTPAHNIYSTTKTITTDILGFACNFCDYTTQNEGDMNAHFAANCSYTSITESTTQLACNSCGWTGEESMEHTLSQPNCSVAEEELILKSYDIIYYVCKTDACEMFSTSLEEIKAHGNTIHPGADHNSCTGGVKIGSTSEDIPYYACENCGFGTQSEAEILAHQAANPGTRDHGDFLSNVQLGVIENPIMGYACRAGDYKTLSLEEMKLHDVANDGKGHEYTVSIFDTIQEYVRTDKVGTGKYCCSECGAER